MQPQEPFRVLVADTFPLIREGLKHLIQQHSEFVLTEEVASAEEIYSACRRRSPDVLVVNGRLPVIEILSQIRLQGSTCKVVMISLYLSEETVYRCVQAGVSSILGLTSPTEMILEAIRTVGQGRQYLPGDVAKMLAKRLSKPSLTIREQEVLTGIAEGKSNQEIGRNLFITETTVKSHVNRIFAKLEVSDRTQALLVGLRSGWVPEEMLYG